jgi:outer membrane protein OmpA-like peptidoglycan-associated protein
MPARLALALLFCAAAATLARAAGPASDVEVRRMIDSLKPVPAASAAPPAAGRTRNLVIEAAPGREPGAAAAGATATPAAPATAPATPAVSPSATRPASPAPGAAPAPQGLSLAIGFEPNSAQLRPESGATLGALVAAMLSPELRQNRFIIEGHTDAVGNPAQNLRLSRDRAEQVRLYLVTLGVDGERLLAVGKGATEPVNARDPRAPENRRVRVVAQP